MHTRTSGTRRRSLTDVRDACQSAAIAEVTERGLGRLTVEGVARRAEVAKTSIYRHWQSVEDLLLDALGQAMPVEEVSPEGDALRSDLLRALGGLVDWLDGPTAPVVAAILAERQRRPDLVEAPAGRYSTPTPRQSSSSPMDRSDGADHLRAEARP